MLICSFIFALQWSVTSSRLIGPVSSAPYTFPFTACEVRISRCHPIVFIAASFQLANLKNGRFCFAHFFRGQKVEIATLIFCPYNFSG